MGLDHSHCAKYLKAAEVHEVVMEDDENKWGTSATLFSERAGHLNEIGKLPKSLWSDCVQAIMGEHQP